MRKNRKGFTLIELLVVIAIIAILAAILFPVFVNAREKARQTTCLSNMSELGKAFKMYLDDSGGVYPHGAGVWEPSSNPNGLPDGDWVWFDGIPAMSGGTFSIPTKTPWNWRINPSKGSMWKYTSKSYSLYICPSDKHAVQKTFTRYGGFGLSYTMNCALNENETSYGDSGAGPYSPGVGAGLAREAQIIRPTKTVLLADQGDGCRSYDPNVQASLAAYNGLEPCYDGAFGWFYAGPTAVHLGGENWLFCDGHAKWTGLKQFRELAFFRDGTPGKSILRPFKFTD